MTGSTDKKTPPSVVSSDLPFFDPGTSTRGLSTGVTVGGTVSSLVQTTGEAALRVHQPEAIFDPGATTSSLAREYTCPSLDQAPGEAVGEMQTATQPLEAPGAGTVTKPLQAPGSVPDDQPSGERHISPSSESEADQISLAGSLESDFHWNQSPEKRLTRKLPAPECCWFQRVLVTEKSTISILTGKNQLQIQC